MTCSVHSGQEKETERVLNQCFELGTPAAGDKVLRGQKKCCSSVSTAGAGAYEAYRKIVRKKAEERLVIVRLPRLFGEGGRGFLEAAYKEKLSECAGVVSPSLGSKSKEDEEDERANDS